jgi:3-deoxy-D-manno-octulosonate 8-phosphate phosphatase KdsC-like HAD superfamily phosphatase
LRNLGATELAMLTGDNPETGKAVASLLPMDAVHAGLLPEQKIALVREAVEKGKKVVMVGDGINDAPALAMATVGVVMGAAGTDVALEAGDVVLMGDDLRKLPFAVRLGRRTLRIIRFNVVFSLASKAVFLVLAPLGLVTLWMGVAADMGVSLLVVGNSMRLLRWSTGFYGSDVTPHPVNGRSGFCAIVVLLLFLLPACDWRGAGQVAITGKTVYAGMAIEEVQVRVFRLDGDQWKESGYGRSGYHGSFIVKSNPGTIRLDAMGKIFRNNKEIPLAGRVIAFEVPSGIRRMDRIVIELAPVPDKAGG